MFGNRFTLLMLLCVCVSTAAADRFVLDTGGYVEGRWSNATDRAAHFDITTAQGIVLQLDHQRVRRIEPGDPAVAETWQLAEDCRQNSLSDLRADLLTQLLEIAPNHPQARRALGFSQVNGQWVQARDVRAAKGYIRYRGRWMLPQEMELLKERQAKESSEKKWRTQLKRWRETLRPEQAREFRESVLAIRDPHAVVALREQLGREPVRGIKMLYIEALANIGTSASRATLVNVSLHDPDEEIYHAAVDEIVRTPSADIVRTYVDALADANNVRVNRAGEALGRLADESAIPAMIDALITKHVFVKGSSGSPDQVTTTFSSPDSFAPGDSGLSTGGGRQEVQVQATNKRVLTALVKMTGQSFGFNQQAWKYWYSNERRAAAIQVRRN